MEEEKKIKISELQDETGAPSSPEIPPKKKSPKKDIPEAHQSLKEAKKISEKKELTEKEWFFDKPILLKGWIFIGLALILIYLSPLKGHLQQETQSFETDIFDFSRLLMVPDAMSFLVDHIWIFVLILPIFMKTHATSSSYFRIDFFGINTVEKVLPEKEYNDKSRRITIKWKEITEAKLAKSSQRDIIQLTINNSNKAELIWDISLIKKRVVSKLLSNFVSKDHPLRVLVEKDLV